MVAHRSLEDLQAFLREQRDAVFRQIIEANEDLSQRVQSLAGSIRLVLDLDDDVLILTFGEPQEAITESVENSVMLRLDPETFKIVGLEVLDFRARMAENPKIAHLVLTALRASGGRITITPDQPDQLSDLLAGDIRELVPA